MIQCPACKGECVVTVFITGYNHVIDCDVCEGKGEVSPDNNTRQCYRCGSTVQSTSIEQRVYCAHCERVVYG